MEECRKPGKLLKRGRACRLLLLVGALGVLVVLGGCTRAFYRKQADKEVNDILQEKDKYQDWKIEQFHVYNDPRARFADPYNPDRYPMPPDDEPTWKLSPHPQQPGHAGVANTEGTAYLDIIKTWDAQNRAERAAETVDTPPELKGTEKEAGYAIDRGGSIQAIYDGPLSQQQRFLLKLEDTVELGLINSREYQSIREDLYLAALPVTQQRFSFAWQWAAIENAIRQWAGPSSLVGHQNNWTLGSSVGVSKLFSTGALLTAAFANTTVFNFLGSANGLSSTSTINLNLVQPLLQGGGKAVTLEPLTQAERTLFYSIRGYARYREEFYISIVLGSALPNTLAGAVGTSGVNSPISVLASLGIASTDVAGQFRGYFPSLFRELDMAVDRKYVVDLEKALLLYEGFQEGGQVAPLQVDQVKSTLLGARNTVLKDMQDTSNALDQFKLQLGVPANMPLALDDSPARPITKQLDRYYEILAQSDAAFKGLEQREQLEPAKLRGSLLQLYTQDPLVRGMPFQKKLPVSWSVWAKATDQELKDRLQKLGLSRRQLLDTKTDLEMKGKTLSAAAASSLREAEFESDLGNLEQILRRYEAQPWQKLAKEDQRRQDRSKLFRLVSYSAEVVLVWARNDRVASVGEQWPTLPDTSYEGFDLLTTNVDLAQERAVEIALTNRWDLMNARAQVVDAWRQLAVTANALLGVLNVQYHLDSTTPPGGTRPLAFSSAATNQELIINAQLPLVRVTERNVYRAAIINYERARRTLMGIEDTIAAQVRFDVRQLHLFAENYKIQKKLVESLYSQVENALEVIVAPVDPDQLKASGTAGQANAAALTNQYLTALGSLNNSQTRMYDIWLSYLATRMQLYEDLERLPLDLRGVWTDESTNPADNQPPAGGTALERSSGTWASSAAGGPALLSPFGGARLGQPVLGKERERSEGAHVIAPAQGQAME
jgi:hypothetical protein